MRVAETIQGWGLDQGWAWIMVGVPIGVGVRTRVAVRVRLLGVMDENRTLDSLALTGKTNASTDHGSPAT
eukprot:1169930-Prymnesium_polylepis.1